MFDVRAPGPTWDNGVVMDVDSFVGCVTRITPRNVDSGRTYPVLIEAFGALPEGAVLSNLVVAPSAAVTFSWVPKRGTEGQTFEACFVARDTLGMAPAGEKAHLKPRTRNPKPETRNPRPEI